MPRITFIDRDGKRHDVDAKVGDSLMEIGRDAGLAIEGACEGAMACSTCHVIVEPEWLDRLEIMGEDEEDMLDLAFGVGERSRLGCQVDVTDALDGLVVRLPADVRNMLLG
jgi:2Fe-2S ferredoxin